MLRVQNERMDISYFPSTREYAQQFQLNKKMLESLNKEIVVMHPGPINRGVEITSDVADAGDQATTGLAAVLVIVQLVAGQRGQFEEGRASIEQCVCSRT